MNYDYPQTDLSRSVLGGLFAGIIAAMANLIFVFIYRAVQEFHEFNSVDVTVIVFGSLLLSIACGIIFYWFIHYLKKGMIFYRIAVLIVTIVIIYAGIALRGSVVGEVPADFRTIVIGTQVIIGGLALFLIPYLFRHDSIIS
ncbi:MAG TPA: hypothetical protein VG738_11990 [Chitinophagaceae bacterium]|nr:hypothetical protein [Chitinophagaceae bacterium]